MIEDCSSSPIVAETAKSPIKSTPLLDAPIGLWLGVFNEASGLLLPFVVCNRADRGLVLQELSPDDGPANPLANRISSSAICCPILLASEWQVMTRWMSPTQEDELCPDLPGSEGPQKLSSPSDIEQSFSDKLSSGESGGTQIKYLKFGEKRFSYCHLIYSGDHRTSE